MEQSTAGIWRPNLIKVSAFLPLIWLSLILVVLHLTSPLNVGPAGTLLLFCLFYAFLNSIFFLILFALQKLIFKLTTRHLFSNRVAYFLASVLALGPVFMLALNTLGQLGFIEFILVLLLVTIASFYVVRRTNT